MSSSGENLLVVEEIRTIIEYIEELVFLFLRVKKNQKGNDNIELFCFVKTVVIQVQNVLMKNMESGV